MQVIRRLYLYGMSGITLGVLLAGLNNLFEVVFHALGLGRGDLLGGLTGDREQLSLAIALTVVGLLVWTIHWLVIERGVQASTPEGEAERGSAIRALYLSIVLAVLLLFGVLAGIQLLNFVTQRLLGVVDNPEFGFFSADTGAAMATVLVTGLAWAYHAVVRRRDLGSSGMTGAAAWIPRVYLYGAALLGLVMTAINIGTLVRVALDALLGTPSDFGDPGFVRRQAADSLAGLIGWSIVFVGHWWYATSLLRGDGWRAASERRAQLRLAYLVAVMAAAAIATVVFSVQALSSALGLALGADRGFGSESPAESMLGPLLALVPWLVAWLLHHRWMVDEARALNDPIRLAAAGRVASAAVALVGIAAMAGGSAGLLGLLVDALLGGDRTSGDIWRNQVADFAAVAFIGAVLWLWNWAALQSRRAEDPAAEARSTVRRAYLLIIFGVSVLGALGSLALLLFELFNSILGVNQFSNPPSEISSSLGALLVAAALAGYHGLAERRDLALRESTSAASEEPMEQPPVAAPQEVATRSLLLKAPTAVDLDAALAAVRAALPPGSSLEED
jgi:hypothetical protein